MKDFDRWFIDSNMQPTEDEIQAVFESWLHRVSPSGDCESVQNQFESSNDYLELFERGDLI
ncbi:hypothetical protein [Chromobacterium subtsugae]|uniref:hypothetical protein n=1 Tax=Chromobacterium subtsugae TaxID=251747 RepID=UPI000B234B14|nr:hypothetical protein [Chromobacterium subtsugae]